MVKYEILKVRDKCDNYYTTVPGLFDVPFRILINGKSQLSGKTTIILNLLANPEFGYDKMFKGENIYIISNNKLDNKLKMLSDRLEIPDDQCTTFDEDYLETLYGQLEDEFMEETSGGGKPENRLIIMDDCGYSNSLKNKQAGIISRLICNGRHINLSQIFTSQKYTQCSTTLRTNITGAILFGTSQKEVDLIAEDMNYFENKKTFIKMFRDATKTPRSFLVVNYSKGLSAETLYYNSEFQPIRVEET
jgi:hypothetical protein